MITGGKEPDKGSAFYKKLTEDFGSYENWEKDFKASGTKTRRPKKMIKVLGFVRHHSLLFLFCL